MFYQLVEKEVLEIVIRVLVDVQYFELKVRGQNKRGWFEVTLTHSPPPPPNSPRFIIANFCTRSRVYRMVYNLAHHVAPAAFRLYFIVSNKLVASCTYIYIYIFALCHEFPTYSSKVFYDMLVGITWLPGKLRSFERATLNSGNTAEQFSSAIDDLLPLPYFSKIFRIYRGENVQHAPSLSFSLLYHLSFSPTSRIRPTEEER